MKRKNQKAYDVSESEGEESSPPSPKTNKRRKKQPLPESDDTDSIYDTDEEEEMKKIVRGKKKADTSIPKGLRQQQKGESGNNNTTNNNDNVAAVKPQQVRKKPGPKPGFKRKPKEPASSSKTMTGFIPIRLSSKPSGLFFEFNQLDQLQASTQNLQAGNEGNQSYRQENNIC